MTTMRTMPVVLAAAIMLATATGVAAQTQSAGYGMEGEIEAGVRFFVDEPSRQEKGKFEEYRDMSSGLFLDRLRLRFFTNDEGYSAEFSGSKWGREDQEFSLSAGRLGLWEFDFEWDQMRHVYSTTARTIADEVSRGDWRLPRLTSLRDFNTADEREVSVRWDTARMGLRLTPTPEWDITAKYTRIRKDGDRPISVAFGSPGNNFMEILEPIEHTIHEFRLGATYARENWQMQFGYTLSVFQNDLNRLIVDNPCFQAPVGGGAAFGCSAGESPTAAPNTTVPPRGQLSLAPDNMAHILTLTGGLTLPRRTRLTGNFSYSLALQNEPFLPMTVNPRLDGIQSIQVPQESLNGAVQTVLFNTGITSRPFPIPLSLSAKYRLYDLHDFSDVVTFTDRVSDDRGNAVSATDTRGERFSFTRHNVDVDGRYQVLTSLATTLGFGWERWNRGSHREAQESDEYFAKLAVDASVTDWLSSRLTYRPSFRRTDYNWRVGLGPFFTTHFDQGERNRQRVDLALQITPLETLSITPTGSWRHDDYIRSDFGLLWETSWSAGFDISWAPTDRVSFSAGYMHEITDRNMQSRATAALVNTDWLSNMADTTDSVHLGGKVGIIKNRLDWTFSGFYAFSDGTIETRNPSAQAGGPALAAGAKAQRFPDFTDEILRIQTSLRYHLSKAWTASLFYTFETFSKNDWRTDTLQPFNEIMAGTTGSIYLGSDQKNYASHIMGVTLGYVFGK